MVPEPRVGRRAPRGQKAKGVRRSAAAAGSADRGAAEAAEATVAAAQAEAEGNSDSEVPICSAGPGEEDCCPANENVKAEAALQAELERKIAEVAAERRAAGIPRRSCPAWLEAEYSTREGKRWG